MINAIESQHQKDMKWIACAIDLSRKAADEGESPFGTIIVASEKIIASAHNQTISLSDPTKHAEIVAIANAVREYGSDILQGATLYSSCAPCMMCLGTIYYAGIRRIVYSLRISDVAILGSGDPHVEPHQLIKSCGLGIKTTRDLCRNEALNVLQETFRLRGSI